MAGDFSSLTYEEIVRKDIEEMPYEVWHEDGEGSLPVFATWREALDAQKKWNRECPGHKARKRRLPLGVRNKD